MEGRSYRMFVLVSLVIQLNTMRGEEPHQEQPLTCPNKTFSCFMDCCERGQAFCNKGEQRCTYCEDKYQLCGTDLIPVECLLYCHERRATHYHACVSKAEIAAIGITPAVILFSAILLLCLYLKKKPLDQWPSFFRALLLRQNSMDKEDNISKSTSDSSLLDLLAPDNEGEHGDGDGKREGLASETLALHGRDQSPQPERGTASQSPADEDIARPANAAAGDLAQNGGGSSRLDSAALDFNARDTSSNGEERSPGLGTATEPPRTTESVHGPNTSLMNPTSEDSQLALGLSMADPSKLYTTSVSCSSPP